MFLLVPAYPGCPVQTAVKWLLLLLLSYFTCPPRGPEKCYHCTLFKTDVINCYTTWHWNVRKSKIAETVKVSNICVHQTLETFGWFLNEIFKKYKGDVFIGAQCSIQPAGVCCCCCVKLLEALDDNADARRQRLANRFEEILPDIEEDLANCWTSASRPLLAWLQHDSVLRAQNHWD